MTRFWRAYLASGGVFLLLDAGWLTLIAPRLYRPRIGELLATQARPIPAMLFYLIYLAGLVVLAVLPAAQQRSLAGALGRGAVFGLCAYAAYDLTNQATLKTWPALVTAADLGWGGLATSIAAAAGYYAASRRGRSPNIVRR